jgi:predicted Zn-dependent protease
MDRRIARVEFKKGLTLLREHHPDKALGHMRRAVTLEEGNPHYLSFFGVAIALAEKKWATAELYCRRALQMKRSEARLHVNLAEVYLGAGRRQDAVQTLRMGLACAKRRDLLVRAFSKLGVRQPLLLPFLNRNHFLNRYSGIARCRILALFPWGLT